MGSQRVQDKEVEAAVKLASRKEGATHKDLAAKLKINLNRSKLVFEIARNTRKLYVTKGGYNNRASIYHVKKGE